jgi:hypothetical protein
LRSILSSFSSAQCGQVRARDSHLCVSFDCATTVDFFRAVSEWLRLSVGCTLSQESAISHRQKYALALNVPIEKSRALVFTPLDLIGTNKFCHCCL